MKSKCFTAMYTHSCLLMMFLSQMNETDTLKIYFKIHFSIIL